MRSLKDDKLKIRNLAVHMSRDQGGVTLFTKVRNNVGTCTPESLLLQRKRGSR